MEALQQSYVPYLDRTQCSHPYIKHWEKLTWRTDTSKAGENSNILKCIEKAKLSSKCNSLCQLSWVKIHCVGQKYLLWKAALSLKPLYWALFQGEPRKEIIHNPDSHYVFNSKWIVPFQLSFLSLMKQIQQYTDKENLPNYFRWEFYLNFCHWFNYWIGNTQNISTCVCVYTYT